MGWLKKLLGREQTHEQWLEKHPGKSSTKAIPTAADPEAEAATRARMEGEMADAREKREQT